MERPIFVLITGFFVPMRMKIIEKSSKDVDVQLPEAGAN
jgi:hypothetical protein